MTWGIVRKFEKGEMMLNINNFLGYTRDGEDEPQFREELKQDVLCTLADMYGGTTPEELDQSIKALQEQLLYYAGLAARDASETGNFQDKFQFLAKQIEDLKSQKVNIEEHKKVCYFW